MKNIVTTLLLVGLLSACGTSKNSSSQQPTKETSSAPAPKAEKTAEKTPKPKEKIISRPVYHPSETMKTDLIHTAVHVSFDWDSLQMSGLASITCSPHFYATDSLILDAKAMKVFWVKMNGKPLQYKYNDEKKLRIGLGKTFTRNDKYTVTIKYIARPEKVKTPGSSAITEAKGLYFINPHGTDPYEMPQIWTQGETESSSVWFPTIDATNQKMTQEIWMTVADKYKTLSNGKLVSSKENGNGTRTDYWKRDLPAAPYLSMMAVGQFAIVKDSYTKEDGTVIPVDFYVEPKWKNDAKAIFGNTPEMIKFYSHLLGMDYQWSKYDQIVVREYVSGAMENTSATVLGDFLYQTKRELIDGNNERVISHELFHHWFGDLVTCESWANITLNESFADYGQYLWDEHKYGRDEADYNAEKEKNQYLMMAKRQGSHNLVYYNYKHIMDVFDTHSYNKGGRILHMLRTYLGDSAFFKGLNLYLNQHKFGTAEVADLRMALEKVSGQDLNWFFNEWYFASYTPILDVSQKIKKDSITLTIKQTQNLDKAPLYKLPLNVAVYANNKKTIHPIVINKSQNTFTFAFKGNLQNVIIDNDRALLGEINYKKPKEWYTFQYLHGSHYMDRKEALERGASLNNQKSTQMILKGLDDKFWDIRRIAITELKHLPDSMHAKIYQRLLFIAKKDKNSHVRGEAVTYLAQHYSDGENKDAVHQFLVQTIKNDPSYLVVSNALSALAKDGDKNANEVMKIAKSLEKEESSSLKAKIMGIYAKHGDASNLDFMANAINSGGIHGYDAISGLFSFVRLLKQQNITTQSKYLPVFRRLSTKGGAYFSRVLPMALMQLKTNATQQSQELTKKKSKLENDKAAEAEINKMTAKINEAKQYIAALDQLNKK